jgi:hypothetical protein
MANRVELTGSRRIVIECMRWGFYLTLVLSIPAVCCEKEEIFFAMTRKIFFDGLSFLVLSRGWLRLLNTDNTAKAIFWITQPKLKKEKQRKLKREKLENIHAFIRLNSICHVHFCLISGVTPKLWQSKLFKCKKGLMWRFFPIISVVTLIAKNASIYPKCQSFFSCSNLCGHTKVVC